jgi:regulator of replication initiation timing
VRPAEAGPEVREQERGKEGFGPRRWLSELGRIAASVITVRERMNDLIEENRRLRGQVERLSELVAHQAGQLEQIDKRIEQAVELHVLKRLEAERDRAGKD